MTKFYAPLRFVFALTALLLWATSLRAQLYDVRSGELNHGRRARPALKVQVDGTAAEVRGFFQDFMKDAYGIRFRSGGVAGVGKKDVLTARQTPASAVSGKLVDLYAALVAPTDTTAEVALFGGFDDDTFFDPEKTKAEFDALRGLLQHFARAARLRTAQQQVAAAERKLREAEKEKERLDRSVTTTQNSTARNLARIEEMKKQNEANARQLRQDSAALVQNARLREASQARLQRRRDQLSALDRKN